MKKILSIAVLCFVALAINAVPAKRGWHTVAQPDGTTVEVQQMGDEFYHYWIDKEGREVRKNAEGVFEVVGQAPTAAEFKARRANTKIQRARRVQKADGFGYTPYLPPKGVVIMANFKDRTFKSTTTKAVIDEMCNSTNCTVNKYNGKNYGSLAQYFRDQSDNKYSIQLDVYGPVTLSGNSATYGGNDSQGNDSHPANAVIEACTLANEEIDFSQYDWNNDGEVDFVYVVYAGIGEADAGTSTAAQNSIWPHSYEIESARYYGDCTYTKAQCKFDGKYVNCYAMSNELSGSSLAGIGIIAHEFGHVIGLPDHYDTDYSTNYNNSLTPNEWDIMDGGSYNGGIHCPPNYNTWEKYFFGWYTPENLGSNGAKLTLKAIGTEGYNSYQVNASGKLQTATTTGLNYYFENRQKQGWDTYLPAAGLVIWKVNYNKSMWENNGPNLTSNGDPHFTLVPSSGTAIGEDYGTKNVFPYGSVNSWSGVSGKPLKDITRSGTNITLTYIEEPVDPKYTVTWIVNGTQIEQQEYAIDGSENLVLPTATVTPCEGTEFIGWTAESEWFDPFENPADLFTTASGKVTNDATYRAVFK